jgi:hypothetical protein
MYAEETRRNTGSPSGDRGKDQLATRERQAGPYGVAERLVRPDQKASRQERAQPLTQRVRVGRVDQEVVRYQEAAVRAPRIHAEATLAPHPRQIGPVEHLEHETKPLLELVLPLLQDRGWRRDHDGLGLFAKEKLAGDETRLDRLAEARVRPRRDLLESVLGLAEEKRESQYYAYSSNREGAELLQTLMGSFVLKIDWTRGTLVPQYDTKFQKACYMLFIKFSAFMRFCKNPDCPAPYFIAKRLTQQYCCQECVNAIQKERKLDWWNRVGSKRRTSANARRSPDSRSERKRDSDA